MDDLQRYYKESLLNDLCSEYRNEWRKTWNDKQKLVNLALQQQSIPHLITYSNAGMGLGKEYIISEFGNFINGNYAAIDVDGVRGGYKTELYVGFNGILSVSNDVSCFMWSTIPSLEIKATKAVKMYCGCGSTVHLTCGGYNSVIAMMFDTSRLILDDVDDESTVTVYRYSEECNVKRGRYCFGKIKEFRKELRL